MFTLLTGKYGQQLLVNLDNVFRISPSKEEGVCHIHSIKNSQHLEVRENFDELATKILSMQKKDK